eukprot:Selendium_serpulae@DN4077_c1_g1_i1.p1
MSYTQPGKGYGGMRSGNPFAADAPARTDAPLSKGAAMRAVASAVVGALLGVAVSLIVNCTLVEISLSPFFATYFGVVFIMVGLIIFWRISSGAAMPHGAQSLAPRKRQLMFFSLLIVTSGVLCFVLEKNWFIGLPTALKIPVYMLLGSSVSFALVFSLVDVVNYVLGFFQHQSARSLVESKQQVNMVVLVALVLGAIFGFIFGALDVAEENRYHVKLALMREEHLCLPLGLLVGGMAGFANEYIRESESYSRVLKSNFDDEI